MDDQDGRQTDKKAEIDNLLKVLMDIIETDEFFKSNIHNEEFQELIETVRNWRVQEKENNKKYDLNQRRDLYTVIKDKREDPNKTIISRLFYASSFADIHKEKADKIGEMLGDWIKETSINYKTTISGFMMVKGHYCIHLMESDSQILNMFIKNLYDEYTNKGSIYETINILAFNEDNPSRLFKTWGHYKPTLSGPQITESDKNEQQLQERVLAIYEKFMQAGNFLANKYSKEYKITQAIWKEVSDEIIISNEDLFILTHPRFMNIKEYYSMYLDDVEIELDSDLHFPQNPNMIDILEYNDKNQPIKEEPEQQELQDNDF